MLAHNSVRLAAIVAATLSLVSCAKPKPVPPPPAPPRMEAPAVRNYHVAPSGPKDVVVKRCTLTREENGKADCICRSAKNRIMSAQDPHEKQKLSLECK